MSASASKQDVHDREPLLPMPQPSFGPFTYTPPYPPSIIKFHPALVLHIITTIVSFTALVLFCLPYGAQCWIAADICLGLIIICNIIRFCHPFSKRVIRVTVEIGSGRNTPQHGKRGLSGLLALILAVVLGLSLIFGSLMPRWMNVMWIVAQAFGWVVAIIELCIVLFHLENKTLTASLTEDPAEDRFQAEQRTMTSGVQASAVHTAQTLV